MRNYNHINKDSLFFFFFFLVRSLNYAMPCFLFLPISKTFQILWVLLRLLINLAYTHSISVLGKHLLSLYPIKKKKNVLSVMFFPFICLADLSVTFSFNDLYYFICFFHLALLSVVYIFTLQGKPFSWQKYKMKKKPLLI